MVTSWHPTSEEGRLVGSALAQGEAPADIAAILRERGVDPRTAARFVRVAEEMLLSSSREVAERIAILRARRLVGLDQSGVAHSYRYSDVARLLRRSTGTGRSGSGRGRRPVAAGRPAGPPQEAVRQLIYESPAEFLTNVHRVYPGERHRLFLGKTEAELTPGVDLPMDIFFRFPSARFRVHGRLSGEALEETLEGGKPLPAGQPVELVERAHDDREALFAYLGLR
jgi:hypothetical protein